MIGDDMLAIGEGDATDDEPEAEALGRLKLVILTFVDWF